MIIRFLILITVITGIALLYDFCCNDKINNFVGLNCRVKFNKTVMQFLLTAYDGTDAGAIDRRMNVRGEHL